MIQAPLNIDLNCPAYFEVLFTYFALFASILFTDSGSHSFFKLDDLEVRQYLRHLCAIITPRCRRVV